MYSESKESIFSNLHESVQNFRVANCDAFKSKLQDKVTLLVGLSNDKLDFVKDVLADPARPHPVRYMNGVFYHLPKDDGLLCVVIVKTNWSLPTLLGNKWLLRKTNKLKVIITMRRGELFRGKDLKTLAEALDLMTLPYNKTCVGMMVIIEKSTKKTYYNSIHKLSANVTHLLQKKVHRNSYLRLIDSENIFPLYQTKESGKKVLKLIKAKFQFMDCDQFRVIDRNMLSVMKQQYVEISKDYDLHADQLRNTFLPGYGFRESSNLVELYEMHERFTTEMRKQFLHKYHNIDYFKTSLRWFYTDFSNNDLPIENSPDDAWEKLVPTGKFNKTQIFAELMLYYLKLMEVLDRSYVTKNERLIKIHQTIYNILENFDKNLESQRIEWLQPIVCVSKEKEIPSEVSKVVDLIDDTRAYVALQWMNMPLARNPEFRIKYTIAANINEQLVTDIETALVKNICILTTMAFQDVLVNIRSNFGMVPIKAEEILLLTKKLSDWLNRFPSIVSNTSFQFKELNDLIVQNNLTVPSNVIEGFKTILRIADRTHFVNLASNEYLSKDYGDKIRFFYVRNVLGIALLEVFAGFKANISKIIVPKMIKSQANLVDKAVTNLDRFLVAGLESNLNDLEPGLWRQVTTQPFYRLFTLKDIPQDMDSFVRSLELYFKIHWVDMGPTEYWSELNEVNKRFKNLEKMLDIPIETKHQWGRAIKESTDYLLHTKSTAATPYSHVNGVAHWMRGAYRSTCGEKTTDSIHGFVTAIIIIVLFVKSLFKF
jgi:hypothetical protein